MTWGTEYGPIHKEFVVKHGIIRVRSKSFSHRVVGQRKTIHITTIIEMTYLRNEMK